MCLKVALMNDKIAFHEQRHVVGEAIPFKIDLGL
jgi:hypothetical protein